MGFVLYAHAINQTRREIKLVLNLPHYKLNCILMNLNWFLCVGACKTSAPPPLHRAKFFVIVGSTLFNRTAEACNNLDNFYTDSAWMTRSLCGRMAIVAVKCPQVWRTARQSGKPIVDFDTVVSSSSPSQFNRATCARQSELNNNKKHKPSFPYLQRGPVTDPKKFHSARLQQSQCRAMLVANPHNPIKSAHTHKHAHNAMFLTTCPCNGIITINTDNW